MIGNCGVRNNPKGTKGRSGVMTNCAGKSVSGKVKTTQQMKMNGERPRPSPPTRTATVYVSLVGAYFHARIGHVLRHACACFLFLSLAS